MKKIYTVTVTTEESKELKKILKGYPSIKRKDVDKTKVFEIQGFKIVQYAIVCEEHIFMEITEKINGEIIY